MPNQILMFLLDNLLGLFSLALLLRFYMQWLRIPHYHPVSRFIVTVTDFIVRPARRWIPGWRGMDLSTLVLAWLTQFILLLGLSFLHGQSEDSLLGLGLLALVAIARLTLMILLVSIIMQAVLSWVNPQNPLMPLLESVTQPLLGIFRRVIPPIANVDLSPLFALLLLQVLLMFIGNLQYQIASWL
ncbi:MAG: YggT family protein [Nitrosomonas sp.]|nr:YggT family protein [Nitrosomonas sp.]